MRMNRYLGDPTLCWLSFFIYSLTLVHGNILVLYLIFVCACWYICIFAMLLCFKKVLTNISSVYICP